MKKERGKSIDNVELNSINVTYAFFGAILMFLVGYFVGGYFGGM